MAIKKVPSDASIRIKSIWFPVRNLPAAQARHTKLVLCLTGSDDHPCSLRGSATGLKFQDRHLLFCCGHQIANIEQRCYPSLDKDSFLLACRSLGAPPFKSLEFEASAKNPRRRNPSRKITVWRGGPTPVPHRREEPRQSQTPRHGLFKNQEL